MVREATLTNDEIHIMLWIQSLSAFRLPVAGAYCPLCRLPVRSWVEHLTAACVVFIIAAAATFRAVLDVMRVDEWSVDVTSLWDGTVNKAGSSLLVSLLWERCQDWPGDLGVHACGIVCFHCSQLSKVYIQTFVAAIHNEEPLSLQTLSVNRVPGVRRYSSALLKLCLGLQWCQAQCPKRPLWFV